MSSNLATPTEQGASTVGGPVHANNDDRTLAARNVKRRGFPALEEEDLLEMLGLTEPGFEWVPAGSGTRKRVPR